MSSRAWLAIWAFGLGLVFLASVPAVYAAFEPAGLGQPASEEATDQVPQEPPVQHLRVVPRPTVH